MPVISISLDNESDTKLTKIAKKLSRNRSDAMRLLIREFNL